MGSYAAERTDDGEVAVTRWQLERPKRSMPESIESRIGEHIDALVDGVGEFFETLNDGSDYELAIGAHAFIEECVRAVLLASLHGVRTSKSGDLICEALPRNYYGKLRLAHAMGRLPGALLEDLDKLRRVRNAFAHNPTRAKFSAFDIVEPLTRLHALSNFPEVGEFRINFSAQDRSEFIEGAARSKFGWVCAHASQVLVEIARRSKPARALNDDMWLTQLDGL